MRALLRGDGLPIGGVRSLITVGENGLLIGVGDEDAMNRALCAIADDPALTERLGNSAAQIQSRLDETLVADNGCAI